MSTLTNVHEIFRILLAWTNKNFGCNVQV